MAGTMNSLWIGDDAGFDAADMMADIPTGKAWSSTGGDKFYPDIVRPIGFMRRKPIIRVKAWTMPVIES